MRDLLISATFQVGATSTLVQPTPFNHWVYACSPTLSCQAAAEVDEVVSNG